MKRLLLVLLLLSAGLNIGLLIRVADESEQRPWSADLHRRPGTGPNRDPMGPRPDGEHLGRRYVGLDLTADQHEQLAALRAERRELMEQSRGEMRELFDTMRVLLQQNDIDRAAVGETRRRLGAVRTEVDSLVSDQLLAELEVLTPEQRKSYLQRMQWDLYGQGSRTHPKR